MFSSWYFVQVAFDMKFQKLFSRILSRGMYCVHKMCKPKRSALAVLPGNKSPQVFWENINQLLRATVFGYVPNTLLISLLTKWTIYFAARILVISYFILIGLADGFFCGHFYKRNFYNSRVHVSAMVFEEVVTTAQNYRSKREAISHMCYVQPLLASFNLFAIFDSFKYSFTGFIDISRDKQKSSDLLCDNENKKLW